MAVDLIVLAIAVLVAIAIVAVLLVLWLRWRRNRYRFTTRAMFIGVGLVSLVLVIVKAYVVPAVNHRLAVHQLWTTAGGLLFDDDFSPTSGNIYSDLRKVNPWRDVYLVHATNDTEAMVVARQLKFVPEVQFLYLSGNITDKGLAAICSAEPSSVIAIDFLESSITSAGLSKLATVPRLRRLFFNTCRISDAELASLKRITGLRQLTLLEEGKSANSSRFSEAEFREIGNLQALEELHLARLHVSDAAAAHLARIANLKTLQLSYCQISEQALVDLQKSLPNCEFKVFSKKQKPTAK